MSGCNFFQEDITFKLPNEAATSAWINKIIHHEGQKLVELNFIFCPDDYLHKMNVDYLNHNTYTDIITFDNAEQQDELQGDIFISIDRVKDNADLLKAPFQDELDRVIIHGVLHLIGYNDKTQNEKVVMREKEEACLSLR